MPYFMTDRIPSPSGDIDQYPRIFDSAVSSIPIFFTPQWKQHFNFKFNSSISKQTLNYSGDLNAPCENILGSSNQ
jgi:hypothetical protein